MGMGHKYAKMGMGMGRVHVTMGMGTATISCVYTNIRILHVTWYFCVLRLQTKVDS